MTEKLKIYVAGKFNVTKKLKVWRNRALLFFWCTEVQNEKIEKLDDRASVVQCSTSRALFEKKLAHG